MEIDEEKLKQILEEQRKEYQEETQRYIGVLSEDSRAQTKLIAESVTGIQEQLFVLRDMVAQNTKAITGLQDQVAALREMVAQNTKDIQVIKTEIVTMREDIEIIKYDLKRKPDRDEFEALERRVLALEKERSTSSTKDRGKLP